jgi:hypothetical protein
MWSGIARPVGHQHLGPLGPHDAHEPADRLVEVGSMEAVRVLVGGGAGHPRVAVAEPVVLVVADDLDRLVELPAPHGGEIGARRLGVGRGVQDVAGLTAGAGHEHGADAFACVPGDGAGPLRRLVVGMGVHREDAGGGHAFSSTSPNPVLLADNGSEHTDDRRGPAPRPPRGVAEEGILDRVGGRRPTGVPSQPAAAGSVAAVTVMSTTPLAVGSMSSNHT